MTPDSYYSRLVTGERKGVVAGALRAGLTVLSWPYAAVVALRNAYYDRCPRAVRRVEVPVISVGNLVTGGTGKTPMVLWMLERLLEMDRRPGVLMRGYKAPSRGCCESVRAFQEAVEGIPNDEALEIRRRCPSARLVIDPDRVAGARKAIARGCDVLVMDDGFQHRRLARDLDVVLIDGTNPFGGGRLLPRGMLREPVGSLRRADVTVITRADHIAPEEVEALRSRLSVLAPRVSVLAACHRPVGICHLDGQVDSDLPLARLAGRRVWVFAGVGNPAAFLATVGKIGLTVVGQRFWPDHHLWSDAELDAMAAQARACRPDLVLTTEKDAVRLPPDGPTWPVPLRVLRVAMEFMGDDSTLLCSRIAQTVGRTNAGPLTSSRTH